MFFYYLSNIVRWIFGVLTFPAAFIGYFMLNTVELQELFHGHSNNDRLYRAYSVDLVLLALMAISSYIILSTFRVKEREAPFRPDGNAIPLFFCFLLGNIFCFGSIFFIIYFFLKGDSTGILYWEGYSNQNVLPLPNINKPLLIKYFTVNLLGLLALGAYFLKFYDDFLLLEFQIENSERIEVSEKELKEIKSELRQVTELYNDLKSKTKT